MLDAATAEREGGAEHALAKDRREPGYHLEIFLISFAGLLLEIAYTRIISFKLFYYYTYLVIGLALLGIGCGAVIVALSKRVREASTDSVLVGGLLAGGVSIGVGYLLVAVLPVTTAKIWRYGTQGSFFNIAMLLLVCFFIFASFVAIGVMIATLFGRRSEGIGRLYFADLLGAGIASAIAVPLLDRISAPSMVMLSGLILAVAALRLAIRDRSVARPFAAVLAILLLVPIVFPRTIPDVRDDGTKDQVSRSNSNFYKWNSIFRIDAHVLPPAFVPHEIVLYHDGLIGSGIYEYNGDVSTLGRYDHDPRSFPFAALGEPPARDLIIGAAGGNEVLASLHFEVGKIDAVELNPVTYSLVRGKYADYDGHIASLPNVNYVLGDGRTFLDQSDKKYSLVWFPAPDSYAATNTATAGAFVLSESYLYTKEAIESSLKHLAPGGLLATQFGEVDYAQRPNRTARYVATTRSALASMGIEDPAQHMIVISSPTQLGAGSVSTILVKREPFTAAEVDRVLAQIQKVPGARLDYGPGQKTPLSLVNSLVIVPSSELQHVYDSYDFDIKPVTDNNPYFWHFSDFTSVIKNFGKPLNPLYPEDATGERVLVLLLAITVLFAAVFLLLPFVLVREEWRRLPRKGRSAVYFAALGLGFMLYEISLIQRFVLFLGYPTYSLTVTLASLLVFTGIGAWISNRYLERPAVVLPVVSVALVLLTLWYVFGLPHVTSALFHTAFTVRVIVTAAMLAPLGLCLGCFMPFGLRAVARLTEHEREYVAWGWAVNGFASVVGSVLTTILAMTFGLEAVLVLAVFFYGIAVAILPSIASSRTGTAGAA